MFAGEVGEPMKILQVTSSLSLRTGGPARAVLEMSEALSKEGVEVTIFATDAGLENNRVRPSSSEKNGVKIHTFKSEWPHPYFYSSPLGRELQKEIRNFNLVHIHGLWVFPTLAASRNCQRQQVPYLVRPCGMLDEYCLAHHAFRKRIYGSLFEKENLRHAQAIHFTSEEERRRSGKFGLKAPAVVIPLGVNAESFEPSGLKGEFRKRHPRLKDKKIILFLGRINFKKGLDLLIDALGELAKTNSGFHCVIAGPDDEGYGARVKGWIENKNFQDWVTFTGFIDGEDKLALLEDSDIFCLPSRQENFGLAAFEAMAAGLPVVVSDQVNLHQEIEKAEAGLGVPCKVGAIASALKTLLNDESLRRSMGECGRKLVEEKYGWSNIAKKLVQAYENITRHH